MKEAHDLFLDMAQLIGGFLAAEDLEPVSQVFLKEHRIAVELHKLREARDRLNVERKAAGKSADSLNGRAARLQQEIDRQQAVISGREKDLEAVRAEIERMRGAYAGNELFAKYEAYRDDGIDLAKLNYSEMRQLRKDLQLIFQDPYSSLNPRMTVGQIIGEGLLAHGFFKKNDARMMDYVI